MNLVKKSSPLFLNHLLISHWKQPTLPLHQSAPSHLLPCPLPALHKVARNHEPMHIHSGDGSCNACRSTGQLSIFDGAYTWKLKVYILCSFTVKHNLSALTCHILLLHFKEFKVHTNSIFINRLHLNDSNNNWLIYEDKLYKWSNIAFLDRSWINICGVSSDNGQYACTSVVGSSVLLHAVVPWPQQPGWLQHYAIKE